MQGDVTRSLFGIFNFSGFRMQELAALNRLLDQDWQKLLSAHLMMMMMVINMMILSMNYVIKMKHGRLRGK